MRKDRRRDRQTDMTKVIVVLRNFANALTILAYSLELKYIYIYIF